MILLPAYFILAEAYISDKNTSEEREVRLKSAENFLFGAYVAFTRYKDKMSGEQGESELTEDEYDQLSATLFKTFAKLFLAQKDLNNAIDRLAKGIYEDSKRFGPESPQVAMSYYQMGLIFIAKGDKEQEVKAFYNKCVEIWFKHFLRHLQMNLDNGMDLTIDRIDLEETLIKEASEVIEKIRIQFSNMPFED